MLQRQLAQRYQIARLKKVAKRPFRTIDWVNITATHTRLQRFGSQVCEYDFVDPLHYPVRDGFADTNTGNVQNRGHQAFDVLNIHGGQHVDVRA